MKKRYTRYFILGLVLLLFNSVQAFGFRCGTRVISVGDFKPRVLAECGEPTYVEIWEEERIFRYFHKPNYSHEDEKRYRKPFYVKEHVTLERWTYNLGAFKFVRYLMFENGKLADITTGEHGY